MLTRIVDLSSSVPDDIMAISNTGSNVNVLQFTA